MDTEERTVAEAAESAEYLQLRCGMLDQIDRDMFSRGLDAGAACGAAAEAFGAARRPEWVQSILLGTLARRNPAALARWTEELAAFERWAASSEFATSPDTVREWAGRDLRRVRAVAWRFPTDAS